MAGRHTNREPQQRPTLAGNLATVQVASRSSLTFISLEGGGCPQRLVHVAIVADTDRRCPPPSGSDRGDGMKMAAGHALTPTHHPPRHTQSLAPAHPD